MVEGLGVNRTRIAWLLGGAVLLLAVLYVVYSFVGTFVFGIFIYYATRPVYRRINRRVADRRIAAVISLFVLALPLLALFAYTLAIGLQEVNRLLDAFDGSQLGQLEAFLKPYIDVSKAVGDPAELLRSPEQLLNQPGIAEGLQTLLDQGVGFTASVGGFVGNALLHLFIMVALAYYLLVDGRRLSRWFQSLFADDRGIVNQFVRDVDRDFENIFFGNILNAFITGIIGALVYSTLDVTLAPAGLNIPYAPLVGLLTGAGSLVPVVGMKIVYVPVALWLALQSLVSAGTETLWFVVVFVAASFVVVDVIPDLGLRPYVSGRHIHTGAIMFAYILGPLLFGWYGLFLGPVLLVLVVHFGRVVVPALVAERHFAPYSVDPRYLDRIAAGTETQSPAADHSPEADEAVPADWVPLSGEKSADADGSSPAEATGSEADDAARDADDSPGDGPDSDDSRARVTDSGNDERSE
jgi:predicted PurR-regulated permease PerM